MLSLTAMAMIITDQLLGVECSDLRLLSDKDKLQVKHKLPPRKNQPRPLSFWESREIYMKGHTKEESAKIYLVLIAIVGLILILVILLICLVCWKESVK